MTLLDLSAGLSGLLISQRSLETIGHNVSNVNTPGYNRQVNVLAAKEPVVTAYGVIGQGVTLEEIKRLKDELIDLKYRAIHLCLVAPRCRIKYLNPWKVSLMRLLNIPLVMR